MPYFNYSCYDDKNKKYNKGIIWSYDKSSAGIYLNEKKYNDIKLKSYMPPVNLMPFFLLFLLIITIVTGLYLLNSTYKNKIDKYQLLIKDGILTKGIISEKNRKTTKDKTEISYVYKFIDKNLNTIKGDIYDTSSLNFKQNYHRLNDIGSNLELNNEITVIYLKNDPSINIPYKISKLHVDKIKREYDFLTGLFALILIILILIAIYQINIERKRIKRILSAERDQTMIMEYVRGELVLFSEPVMPAVIEDQRAALKKHTGYAYEDTKWKGFLQLFVCVAVYYIASVIIWSFYPQNDRTFRGVIVQPWQLSFALSIIVVPIMIILISFKPKLYTLIIYGLITCTAHYFMLKMTYEKITANHLLFVIVNKHLLISICAWLIPTWLMIYAERSNFIRKMLCMDKPL